MPQQPTELSVQAGSVGAKVIKSGRGEPLLYLRGVFGHEGWPAFLERLAEQFTVYAPIHQGFDETAGIDQIDDILDLALYHFDLLDALGLDSAHFVGHFYGAMIAAEMASLCSHRINKLVLASPAGLWLDDNPGVDYFATPPTKLRGLLFHEPDSDIARITMPEADGDEDRGRQDIARVRALSTVAKFLWPIPDKGLKKRLHRIKAPTLVVMADGDQIVPHAIGDEFAVRILGSRVQTVEGAGHMFLLEQPDAFAGIVAEFCA